MATKREQVCSVIDEIDKIYTAWRKNDDPSLWKQNRMHHTYKQVTPDFFPAVTDLINLVASDEYEFDSYSLVMACDQFIDEWLDWVKELNSDRKDVRLDGTDAIWNAWGRVIEQKKPRTFPSVEPIDQLINNKVPNLQICKIYGFLDDIGRPDLARLQEAKINGVPEDWVSPVQIDYEAKLKCLWADRLESFADGSRNWDIERKEPIPVGGDGIDRSQWQDPGPSVDSLERLLRLKGMTTGQIMQMTGLTAKEIGEFALDMGIALDGGSANELLEQDDSNINHEFLKNRDRLQHEIDLKKNSEAKKIDNYKELGDDIITRVFSMTDDGVGAGAILRSLKEEFPLTTYEQVLGWQARRENLKTEIVDTVKSDAKPAKKTTKKKTKKKTPEKAV